VVEGVGDHACEYMTGGLAVILGPTGRNFGAGMSGGIAYVYDPNNQFSDRCNHEMISLEKVEEKGDVSRLYTMITEHERVTKSEVAKQILGSWNTSLDMYVIRSFFCSCGM